MRRTFPHTSAHFPHAHARTLPHTSAHFRTLSARFPHTFRTTGGVTGPFPHTSAHFRALSAHFPHTTRRKEACPHTSAHFRTLPHSFRTCWFGRMQGSKSAACGPWPKHSPSFVRTPRAVGPRNVGRSGTPDLDGFPAQCTAKVLAKKQGRSRSAGYVSWIPLHRWTHCFTVASLGVAWRSSQTCYARGWGSVVWLSRSFISVTLTLFTGTRSRPQQLPR